MTFKVLNSIRMAVFVASICLLPAFAVAGECYTPEEFEAEQGLRLHTDLEVIMLTCKYDGYKRPLKDSYAVFLKKYSAQIRKWENTIARVYASTGGSRNEVIDNFRTSLANQKSHEASTMGPRPFCVAYANWVPAVAAWSGDQVLNYVRTPDNARVTRKPLCQ
jgi:hypothetical protein